MKAMMHDGSTMKGVWISSGGRLAGATAAMLLAMWLSPAAPAAELEVRQSGGADHTTIQSAIDAAEPGDTITILDSAIYVEDVSFGQLHPSFLDSKENVTLQSAEGERPTIQAANIADRFGQFTADFNGMLVLSQGVSLKGLNIRNGADASGALLGLAVALSIHASNVTVTDCDLDQAGGVVAPTTSVVALVSDLARLGGGPATVDNVVFRDCTIHDGTRIGVAVFPVAFALDAGVVGSVLHVTLEQCVLRNNAGPGIETDGPGSITLTDVIVESGGGNGMELATAQMIVTDCASRGNSGSGIVVSIPDQVPPGTVVTPTLSADGLACSGNGGDGVEVLTGPATIANLVCATNAGFNLHFKPIGDFTLEVDHATLYHEPGDPANPPNLQIDAGGVVTGPRLVLRNSILLGPVSIFDYPDLPADDVVFDNSMFWNGGAAVASNVGYTVTRAVASVDPLLVDPPNQDYRLMATSPVAGADDQGGPLGGAGIVSALPASITIGAVGVASGQFFLEWEGTPNVTFDVRGGATLDTDTWSVIESVTGTTGIQHWEDPRPSLTRHFYGIEGRRP